MTVWGQITWIVARGGGFIAYILVTLAVVEGLALSLRWQSPARWPRIINNEIHQFLIVLALFFGVVHGLAVWLDPFTRFRPIEVLVPFVSHYRPLWMAFGILSFYLGIAVGLSVYLRTRIGYRWWRMLHYLTFLVFVLATIHGIGTGSDTSARWAAAIYGSSVGVVLMMTCARLLKPAKAGAPRRWGWSTAIAALVAAGALWTAEGPMQPGWNVFANNGHGSGGQVQAAPLPTPQAVIALPIASAFNGQVTTVGPDPHGLISLQFRTTLQNPQTAALDIVLNAYPVERGGLELVAGRILLIEGGVTYEGPVTDVNGSQIIAVLNKNGQSSSSLDATVVINALDLRRGSVSGDLQARQSTPQLPPPTGKTRSD